MSASRPKGAALESSWNTSSHGAWRVGCRGSLFARDHTAIVARLVGCNELFQGGKEAQFSKNRGADVPNGQGDLGAHADTKANDEDRTESARGTELAILM